MNGINRKSLMMAACLLAALMVCALPAAALARAPQGEVRQPTINLMVNQEHTLPIKCNAIAIGNASIASAVETPDKNGVLITAKSEGSTDLRLWPTEQQGTILLYTIRVEAKDVDELKNNIEQLIGAMMGVEVKVLNGQIVLDGTVLRRSDRDRLDRIKEQFPLLDLTENRFSEIENTEAARAMEAEENKIIEDIKRDLRDQGLLYSGPEGDSVNVTMRTVRGERRLYLTGIVFGDDHLATLNTVVQSYYEEDKVTNLVQAENPVIEIEVQLAGLNQDATKDIGNNNAWSSFMRGGMDMLTYQSGPGWNSPTFTAGQGANTALTALNSLGATYQYKRQAQSVKSGQTAEFASGGEAFFAIQGLQSATMDSVEFGFKVTVTPTLFENGKVNLVIEVEDSQPISQAAFSSDAIMSIDKFTQSTTMDVEVGQTVILTGHESNYASEVISETPFLGRIPLLNLFFKAKTRRNDKVNTVLLLTPTQPKYFPKNVPDITEELANFNLAARDETASESRSLKRTVTWWNPFTWH